MSASVTDPRATLAELEASNRFLVQQVFKPIANEYRISIPSPGSTEEGRPLLFVKQKRMAIKEDIRFRLDPDAEPYLFMIKSQSVFEFRGRHNVLDPDGNVVGMLEKDFGKSLLRSHWNVRDPAGELLFEAHEASWVIALVRRFAELGPGLVRPADLPAVQLRAEARRRRRSVSTSACSARSAIATCVELEPGLEDVDRRLVIAFTIALDALQDR